MPPQRNIFMACQNICLFRCSVNSPKIIPLKQRHPPTPFWNSDLKPFNGNSGNNFRCRGLNPSPSPSFGISSKAHVLLLCFQLQCTTTPSGPPLFLLLVLQLLLHVTPTESRKELPNWINRLIPPTNTRRRRRRTKCCSWVRWRAHIRDVRAQ